MSRTMFFAIATCSLTGCVTSNTRMPLVDMKFISTPDKGEWTERANESHPLRVAIIRGARLTYPRPSDLLKAAEAPNGGSPQLILRAGRALSPGTGIVVLGTSRSLADEAMSGSVTDLAVYQLGLECEAADIDAPGDLRNCTGYFLRVAHTWPAEVYEVRKATVSVLPEGGSARGRLHLQSAPAGLTVQLDGEFMASLVELGVIGPPLVQAAPGK
jgi:hypothetical protein